MRKPDPLQDRPEDLFGPTPLETLPMPTADKVGPGCPPESSRWRKGCKSPNPKGRPPRPKAGPLTAKMAETVQVTIDGKRKAMTRREVLDRLVRHQAQIKGGRWLGIWEERQARDRALAELLAAFEAEERVLAQLRLDQPHVVMRQQRHAQERAQGKMLDQIERVAPGLLDCLSQLHDAGAVEQQDGRLVKADWLCKASATNDPKAGSR